MSAESGIATFRDAQTGLWSKFRPEDLATPQAFSAHPARVWSWYEERREKVIEAKPHAGHFALVELESRVPQLSIVTQNVDSLHQRSGSRNVIELHGNIMRSICHLTARPIDDEWLAKSNDCPPRSPWAQAGLARPEVVWFGEALPAQAMEEAMNAAVLCDFCFSIGTTSQVQPAASLPLLALDVFYAVRQIHLTCQTDDPELEKAQEKTFSWAFSRIEQVLIRITSASASRFVNSRPWDAASTSTIFIESYSFI